MVTDARHRLATVKKLPYDAEIEYLESTGTQYIDTGVGGVSPNSIRIVIDATPTYGIWPGATFGFQHNGVTGGTWLGIRTNAGLAYFKSYYTTLSFSETSGRHIYDWNGGSGLSVDNSSKGVATATIGSDAIGQLTWLIGAMRDFGRTGPQDFSRMSVYSVRVYIDSVLVRDFTPVRISTTGYMYDRANPKGGPLGNGLYPNQGTGDFILGKDVAYPKIKFETTYRKPQIWIKPLTAKDYVQDGLVAMWDGIENAGGGIHSSSATVWKDLINNKAFTLTSAGTWGDDCLISDGTSQAATMSESIADPIFENRPQWEAVFQLDDISRAEGGVFSTRTSSNNSIPGRIQLGKGYTSGGPIQFIIQRRTNKTCDALKHSCSVNYTGRNAVVAGYMDGSPLTYLGNDGSGDFSYGACIGARTNNVYKMKCKVFCVRIYSRALTASEISHNYAIDKIRFNLP